MIRADIQQQIPFIVGNLIKAMHLLPDVRALPEVLFITLQHALTGVIERKIQRLCYRVIVVAGVQIIQKNPFITRRQFLTEQGQFGQILFRWRAAE